MCKGTGGTHYDEARLKTHEVATRYSSDNVHSERIICVKLSYVDETILGISVLATRGLNREGPATGFFFACLYSLLYNVW